MDLETIDTSGCLPFQQQPSRRLPSLLQPKGKNENEKMKCETNEE